MGMKDCIRSAQMQGKISLEDAQALYRRYDDIARRVLSPAAVRQQLIAEAEAVALEARRRDLLQETRRLELEQQVMGHTDSKGRAAPQDALPYLIEHHGQAKFQDVEHKKLAILGQVHAKMEEVLHEFRKGGLSGELRRRNPEMVARMENVVRELFGQSTGDTRAAQLSAAWHDVAESLRQRFNAAGGAIGKLEKWGMPQVHAQDALLAAGKDKWMGTIAPQLDRQRMKNPLTGEVMSDAELTQALDHVYDTIVSEGWNTRQPSSQPQGAGALFKQHADHRFLIFKDADSWLAYQKDFGEGDPFASMMGHLSMMARDIAAMEVLGPNPDAMLNYLRGLVQKQAPGADATTKGLHKLDEMWAHYRGSANMPVSGVMANTVAGARNLVSAAALGSASMSAVSDLGFSTIARGFVGIPVLKALSSYLKQFTTANTREAVRAGLILDSALHAMHQQARYIGSISGRTWTGYINDRVLTWSGLQAMTQAGKHAFGMDFQAFAADLARFAWDELEGQGGGGAFRRTLERHGFDAASWDQIRAAPQYQSHRGQGFVAAADATGTGFLRPAEIAGVAGQELADRYVSMILRETKFAVPESTIASRAVMVGTNQPGTFVGELVRSAGQFKSFGVAVLMLQGGRIFRELAGGSKARGALYGGALLIVSTILGGVAMQLKEIANGRDPRRMDPLDKMGRKFWGAAMLQGGGFGIYGDFLFADVNRFGGSLSGTVAGPMVDKLDNIRKLTIGNFIEFAEGKDKTNFGRELSKFIRSNTPGQSLWFARQAWDRVLMDQLQYLMDKDAHTAFRRQVQRRQKEMGQEFWWRPGETAPRRGPDLERMFPGR